MKAGFYGLNGKEISLISIILVSTTVIIWSWERTPRLTSFVPSYTLMQFSSEILLSVSDEEAKNLVEAGENHGVPTLSNPTKSEVKRNEVEVEETSKQEDHRTDIVMDSSQRSSLISGKDGSGLNNVTENKVSNYAKGKWVPDNHYE
ncbi:trichome birefringence 16 [Spatholobus suberectus]|nr:trichome birefringence 16 [Spatholobus suberectus]